jgi:hypothetical protein
MKGYMKSFKDDAEAMQHVTDVAEHLARTARFAANVGHLTMEDYQFINGEVCKLFAEFHLQQIDFNTLDYNLHHLESRVNHAVEQNMTGVLRGLWSHRETPASFKH